MRKRNAPSTWIKGYIKDDTIIIPEQLIFVKGVYLMRTCKHDRDIQCLHDCTGCSEYIEESENKCCECSGVGDGLIKYDHDYYCPECLATMLSEKSTSVVDAFLTEHFNEFVEFVAFVC